MSISPNAFLWFILIVWIVGYCVTMGVRAIYESLLEEGASKKFLTGMFIGTIISLLVFAYYGLK